MPLFVAPLVALAVGILLGHRGFGSLGASGAATARRCTVWFAALAFFPLTAFPALYRPGWAWFHVTDPARIPSFVSLIAAAAASSVVVFGADAGRVLATKPPSWARLAAAVPLAFGAFLLVALRHRVLMLEPARRNAEAAPLFGSRFATGLAVMTVLAAVAVWLTLDTIDSIELADGVRPGARGERTLGRGFPPATNVDDGSEG